MDDEMNPGPLPPGTPEIPESDVPGALERFLMGRDTGSVASAADARNQTRPETFVAGAAQEPCPEPGDWTLLLARTPQPEDIERASALLTHAAACPECSGRLRILSADVSPAESSILAKLNSSSSPVQRNLAEELARTPRAAEPQRSLRYYYWTGAGMAASLLIALGLLSWWRLANNPEHLIAEAYTQARIFDLRMPEAAFAEVAPVRHVRGAGSPHEPASLVVARTHIEHQLQATPNDPHLQQLEARSEILEEKYDPAIDILERLVAKGPVTAGLLLDDASAYFERGIATDSESDRATALEYLRRADELAPGDPVVLFNEAVVMEERGQLMNAVETWNRYLRFERDARWLADGRRRLQALEQKLNQMKKQPPPS